MELAPGVCLGPYEIVALLGAGGMGEVYRARDTRLNRTVAIKVLAPGASADSDRRERFEREARAVSSLNHPHICTLYDVGREGDVDYLVMEYVDGETLEERLRRGPLPAAHVLRHATELADALDRAHRQGVVHRDVKPGNIVLTGSGVKLLDFGLARLHPVTADELGALATRSKPLTVEGTILGTLHYMAPEQLQGAEADARSDLFALGAVMYEMATGRRAFDGSSAASIIAAVLDRDPPPIASLQPLTPPGLARIILRCLAKDREERWTSAHDVLLQLRDVAKEIEAPAAPPRRGTRRVQAVAIAGAVAAAAAMLGITAGWRPRSDAPALAMTTAIERPAVPAGIFLVPAISPDGSRLVLWSTFGLTGAAGRLWLRDMRTGRVHQLDGTAGAREAFWSPDGGSIGFFVAGELKRVSAAGGAVQTVCREVGSNRQVGQGGTWNAEGTIVFPAEGRLWRVPARGGTPEALDVSLGPDFMFAAASFLPDGRRFLVRGIRHGSGIGESSIYMASIDGGQPVWLADASSGAVYAPPGYLLFVRGRALIAQRFDPDRAAVTGEPVPLADDVRVFASGKGLFDVSRTGVLVYQRGSDAVSRLQWFDRAGRAGAVVGTTAEFYSVDVSPDGTRAVVEVIDRHSGTGSVGSIWTADIDRGTMARLTANEGWEYTPVWSPDGRRVAYSHAAGRGSTSLLAITAGGSAQPAQLARSDRDGCATCTGSAMFPTAWSPDGRLIAFTRPGVRGNSDVWVIEADAPDASPRALLQTSFMEAQASWSRDGRLLAFTSEQTGHQEVYVEPFPATGERWLVSPAGGSHPRWSGNGRELYYLSADNKLVAVPVRTTVRFEPGVPQPLFEHPVMVKILTRFTYDASPDGKRFLFVVRQNESEDSLTVVTNWTGLLQQ